MASLPAPKTELTKRLERSKRQFFQWFYLEKQPIQWVKNEMDKLSTSLRDVSGENFAASEDHWRNRQRHWNEKEWHIKQKDRGPHLVVPASLLHLPLWRKGNKDVGDWRNAGQMVEKRSHHRSFVVDNDRLQIDQGPYGGLRFGSLHEETNSELSSYDSHNEILRTPSQSSASSETASVSSTSWYSLPESRFLSDTRTLQQTNNVFNPSTGIHPPLVPLLEAQINTEGFYDQESIIQSMRPAPTIPTSPFDSNHAADGNVTFPSGRMEVPSYDSYISGPPHTSSHNLPSESLCPITYSHMYMDTALSPRAPNEYLQRALEVPTPHSRTIQPSHSQYQYGTSNGPD